MTELTNAIYCASVNMKPCFELDHFSKLKNYKAQRAIAKSVSKDKKVAYSLILEINSHTKI